MENFKILTFNFLGVPFISKNYNKRLSFLVSELCRIKTDIICLQEIWLPKARKKIMTELIKYGYRYFFYPVPKNRVSGLLFCSVFPILNKKSAEVRAHFTGFNASLIELFVAKGFLQLEIELPNKETVSVFNIHLTNDHTNQFKKESSYGHIQKESLNKLAEEINTLGIKKIIVVGDFNFPSNSWFYHYFLKISGVNEVLCEEVKTTTKNILKLPFLNKLGRGSRDYIFIKNIDKENVEKINLLWSQPNKNFGYLSDHVGVLAELKI